MVRWSDLIMIGAGRARMDIMGMICDDEHKTTRYTGDGIVEGNWRIGHFPRAWVWLRSWCCYICRDGLAITLEYRKDSWSCMHHNGYLQQRRGRAAVTD